MDRPRDDDFAPFYAAYVARVPDGDVLATLAASRTSIRDLFASFGEARAGHRYAPGKWSVKEVLGHLIDGERIFATRALCFARGETAPLPGFDENVYVAHSGADRRPLADLLAEYDAVRAASLALFRSLDADALARAGVANGNRVVVRAIPWILAGHELHHADVVAARYR